jgi:ParB family transcriptional regulator, chromosome partitioning protein
MNSVLKESEKLGNSLAAFLAGDQDVPEIDVSLDDIAIRSQVRETFQHEENSLADLGKSLRKRQLQAIVLRPDPRGEKPYELVIGERRCRGARIEGLPKLRAVVFDMTDEEAEEAQFAENIHRENLTQLEEAKRLKRDLDMLGSVEAVLAKHQKSKSWLSKRLALLDLPPQTRRLVTENITSDKEVIGQIRTLEKKDANKAKAAVDAIKARGPKGDARGIAKAAKDEVKPSTQSRKNVGEAKPSGGGAAAGSMATAPDMSHQAPGPASVFPVAPTKPYQRVLRGVFDAVVNLSGKPAEVVKSLSDEDRDLAMAHLQSFFVKGGKAVDLAHGLIQGLRSGSFGAEEEACLALASFVQGFEKKPALDLVDALKSVQNS